MDGGAQTAKKILSITLNVLVYVFFAVCLFALILSVATKKDADGTATLFGRQMRIVVSPSMEKCAETDVSAYKIKDIPVKSMVFIQAVPDDEAKAQQWYAALKPGDVLTFKYVYVKQETITHRITAITPKPEGGYRIELAGDNKSAAADTLTQIIDTSLADSPNYVVGKVTGVSRSLGLLVTAVKSKVGIVCIIIIPCLVVIVFEIIRIIGVVNEGKKKKLADAQAEKDRELAKKDEELAELKRRLDQLNPTQTDEVSQPPDDAQS